MTSHVVYNILTYWKIVYIFKIIEWNHFVCVYRPLNWRTMCKFYGRHDKQLDSRPLDFQNQMICFLFGGKQFGIVTGWADFN